MVAGVGRSRDLRCISTRAMSCSFKASERRATVLFSRLALQESDWMIMGPGGALRPAGARKECAGSWRDRPDGTARGSAEGSVRREDYWPYRCSIDGVTSDSPCCDLVEPVAGQVAVRDFYVTLISWLGRLARNATSMRDLREARSTGRLLRLHVHASQLLMAWSVRWMSGAGTLACRRRNWPGRLACALRWSAGCSALVRRIPRSRPLSPLPVRCR